MTFVGNSATTNLSTTSSSSKRSLRAIYDVYAADTMPMELMGFLTGCC